MEKEADMFRDRVGVGKVAAIVVVFVMLLAAGLGCSSKSTADSNDRAMLVSAAMSLTDEHMSSMASTLETLAMTSDVKTGNNWEGTKSLLSKAGQGEVSAALWYAMPDGSYYTVEKGKTSENISDRSYFPKVMAGNTTSGDLVVSKSTGTKSVVVTAPIKDGSKVVGILGASIYLDALTETVTKEMELPDGVAFYAIAPAGVIALYKDVNRILGTSADFNSSSFSQAVTDMLAKKSGVASYQLDGATWSATYKTSSVSGWCFVLSDKK